MKKLTTPLAAVALLFVAGCWSGCASVTQTAETTSTNPTNGVVTVMKARSSIIASGDAKTIVDRVRASAGKTSSVGAYGVAEDSTTAGLQAIFKILLDAAMKAQPAQ